ncbi:MAG: hypothetical protein IJ026_00780 [Candidatus Methanomethylophilaceae archaeon]|nr:hypothetical protein [Candidatus Methanomethylophilaceae archaeon]
MCDLSDPRSDMRGIIPCITAFHLAEEAGMFCEAFSDAVESSGIDTGGWNFVHQSDEPYEIYFEWWFGDVRLGAVLQADRDGSAWFVNTPSRRRRGRFNGDHVTAASEMVRIIRGGDL